MVMTVELRGEGLTESRSVWGREVAGSIPAIPTRDKIGLSLRLSALTVIVVSVLVALTMAYWTATAAPADTGWAEIGSDNTVDMAAALARGWVVMLAGMTISAGLLAVDAIRQFVRST